MRFSSRVPSNLEPNPWAARLASRRAAGASLLDLTEANPTRTGLAPETPASRARWSDAALGRYAPDPRGDEAARGAIAAYYRDRGLRAEPDAIVLTASPRRAASASSPACSAASRHDPVG